jgi:hypothetical protein
VYPLPQPLLIIPPGAASVCEISGLAFKFLPSLRYIVAARPWRLGLGQVLVTWPRRNDNNIEYQCGAKWDYEELELVWWLLLTHQLFWGLQGLIALFYAGLSLFPVHCWKNLEDLAQISAVKSKAQDESSLYTTYFRAIYSKKVEFIKNMPALLSYTV